MTNKTAKTDHPILDLLQNRWSPRAFANKPVHPEKLLSVLEAARWSASSNNGQPWRFIVASKTDAASHEKLVDCLMQGNQSWAKDAPVLILAIAKTTFEREGNPPNKHAWYDTGAAIASLTVQAMALDLYVHQMGGFMADKAREVFNIPAGFEPTSVIALGYLGDPNQLPDTYKARELATRDRKPLNELVFSNSFGNPMDLVSG